MIIFLVTLILTCLFYLIYLLVIRNNVEDLKNEIKSKIDDFFSNDMIRINEIIESEY